MKITSNTKISALIKENPEAIDAIASINSHFSKLRNPVVRKILASRVTISDAARIGGTEVAVFFEKLAPLGFQPEFDSVSSKKNIEASKPVTVEKPAKPTDMPADWVTLDVREALSTGHDPFADIIDSLNKLHPNQGLLLINTFEPTPLFNILNKRGFRHFVEEISPELFHTHLYKSVAFSEKKVTEPVQDHTEKDDLTFGEAWQKFSGNLHELDVREMEMPLPMVTILETLPTLKEQEALLVHHRRVPQYLLPQLKESGFTWAVKEAAPHEVKLLIYKN